MKYLVLVLLFVGVMSCNKPQEPTFLCDAAKLGAQLFSDKISTRWSCDNAKVFAFVSTPLNNTLCSATKGLLGAMVCPLALNALKNLGADQIVSNFSCDKVKVMADFDNIDKLCALLPL
jgi:hypothetical protein